MQVRRANQCMLTHQDDASPESMQRRNPTASGSWTQAQPTSQTQLGAPHRWQQPWAARRAGTTGWTGRRRGQPPAARNCLAAGAARRSPQARPRPCQWAGWASAAGWAAGRLWRPAACRPVAPRQSRARTAARAAPAAPLPQVGCWQGSLHRGRRWWRLSGQVARSRHWLQLRWAGWPPLRSRRWLGWSWAGVQPPTVLVLMAWPGS